MQVIVFFSTLFSEYTHTHIYTQHDRRGFGLIPIYITYVYNTGIHIGEKGSAAAHRITGVIIAGDDEWGGRTAARREGPLPFFFFVYVGLTDY